MKVVGVLMPDNIIRSKLYYATFDNRISTGSRCFYIYCLSCISSNDSLDFNADILDFNSDYLCDLFNCSLKTLYNWINDLVDSRLIKFGNNEICVCW